jgi:hypothetical protein
MTDVTTVVDTYLSMWNEPDRAKRAEIVRTAWAAEGAYWDPMLEAHGHDEMVGMVDAVQAQFPGQRFRRTTGVDHHHELVRFGWELAAPDGAVTVAGVDVGVIGADGRLTRIAGFFGEPPALDAA